MTPENQEYKKIPIWTWKNASADLKEKIVENWRNKYSAQDTLYAEDDGILYLEKPKIYGYEVFSGNIPKYWNIGYGHEYVKFDLTIKDISKFKQAFGFSDRLWNKIDIDFENKRNEQANTKMKILLDGDELDFDESYESNVKYAETYITSKEFEKLRKISDIFDKLMDSSLDNLRQNYEYEFSEENIKKIIEANEYKFNENGEIES